MKAHLRLASILVCVLALHSGIPVLASGQAMKTARGDVLIPSATGKTFIQPAVGNRVELPLPKTARVSDLRSSATGWFAAAVADLDGAPRIHLFKGQGEVIEDLPSPAVAPAREIRQPIFVAAKNEILGLIWLAGEAHHQLAVTSARWLDGHWSEPEVISPPGKGTQIALASTVLGDGSWMVIWAAFDGNDDEILWSRWSAGAWSKPQPIAEDNAVPDITPHLVTTSQGALAAWSRYDGNDYRINVARFDGESWTRPAVIGPKGSTAPTFSEAEIPYLIYHHADPQAWGILELDPKGSVVREAAVELAEPRRPILARVSERDVVFEWISLEQQAVSAPLAWVERAADHR